MTDISKEDLIYAAAILDGEGCIMIGAHPKPNYLLEQELAIKKEISNLNKGKYGGK